MTVPIVSLRIVVSAPANRAVPDTRCRLVSSFTALVSVMPGSSTMSAAMTTVLRFSGPTRLATAMATMPATTPAIASLGFVQTRAALRCEFEHADQQADQTGGSDVEPGQAQQARDGRGGEAETEHLHRALSSRRRLRERAKLRMSFGDADAAGHHVFGDAIGLA